MLYEKTNKPVKPCTYDFNVLRVSVRIVEDAIELGLQLHANLPTAANLVQLTCRLVKAKRTLRSTTATTAAGHLGALGGRTLVRT